jgi:type II secretory pathway pseudopilin PulG
MTTATSSSQASPDRQWRRAFTMMELTVSIAILVIIILSVGVTFSGASKSVSVSNATMEMMSGVRAAQSRIQEDVSHLDRNGYIAIRVRLNNPGPGNAANGQPLAEISYHFDQISFIANGDYSNRTGADTSTPFTDSSSASAAHIWIGQGVLEALNPPVESANPPVSSYFSSDQSVMTPIDQLPTGAFPNNPGGIKQAEMTLMRHQALLMPGPRDGTSHITPAGNKVAAHGGLENVPANFVSGSNTVDGVNAHISSSRYCVVAQTPAEVYRSILADTPANAWSNHPFAVPEIDLFTYRFRALATVYDTQVNNNPFANGYFRTTPVMLQGVSSFKIEWTDGKIYPPTDSRGGQLKWYGPTQLSGGNAYPNPSGNPSPTYDPLIYGYDGSAPGLQLEEVSSTGIIHNVGGNGVNTGDHYSVAFNYSNKDRWPKALRFTMHIFSDRLSGGRDFVQVVNLPQ